MRLAAYVTKGSRTPEAFLNLTHLKYFQSQNPKISKSKEPKSFVTYFAKEIIIIRQIGMEEEFRLKYEMVL